LILPEEQAYVKDLFMHLRLSYLIGETEDGSLNQLQRAGPHV